VLSLATALIAVLLQPAGLLFTVFASDVLHMTPVTISTLIIASGAAGGAAYIAGGYLTDRFGRRWPAIGLTATTAIADQPELFDGDQRLCGRQCALEHHRERGDPGLWRVVR